ncbi:MAG: hypothetical protein Q4D81_10345, partial [Eubacteriales bacterium]|nr:hypothetical protein [Eubacteriales bacterium]
EYIQGCISVLFSYSVGNVFRRLPGRPPFFEPLFFSGESYTTTGIMPLQALFYIFLFPHCLLNGSDLSDYLPETVPK